MHRVLSFDIGIKNLSFCLIEKGQGKTKIIEWANVCVLDDNQKANKIGMEPLVECVLLALSERFGDAMHPVDVVVIENQPSLLNGLMKTVSVVVYTFFNMLKLMHGNVSEVRFVSASSKLKCERAAAITPAPTTYKLRKNASIAAARSYLDDVFVDHREWFEKQSKKDDLSDCLLQAMYWFELRS